MITFKSAPAFFEKEKDGRKPNTFRKDDPNDARFQRLNEKRWLEQPTRIRIINTETGETFIRTITDISHYDGWWIISWRHTT